MPHTKMFKACSQRQPKSPLSAPYSEIPPKKSPLPHGWGLFRYNILMTSIIHRISCFVACPMKRKGKASRVRWKNRCRFPAGLICASGVKAVSANSGGRIDRTRSMSRMSLECLRCIPLAASRVVSMSAPYRALMERAQPSRSIAGLCLSGSDSASEERLSNRRSERNLSNCPRMVMSEKGAVPCPSAARCSSWTRTGVPSW